MNNTGKLIECVSAEIIRPRNTEASGEWVGIFDVEHIRDGKSIHTERNYNLLTTEGKRYIVDIAMKGATNVFTLHNAWYVMLSGTSETAAVGMNYDIPGFTEFVDYVEAVRQTWVGVLDTTAASMTNNAAKATFTISAPTVNAGTVYGAGLVCLSTKSNSIAGDYLLNYSKFATALAVVANDVIRIGVTVTLT